jgi:hypothetical protein
VNPEPPPLPPPLPVTGRAHLVAGAVSVVLFILALALPALELRRESGMSEIWRGYQALGLGWMGVFVGIGAWFANPFLLGAWICIGLRLRIVARVLAGIAVIIGVQTFFVVGTTVPMDEGGVNKAALGPLLPAAWLWFAGLLAALLASWLVRPRLRGDQA